MQKTKAVTVIGAGLMGHGIAYRFARGGWSVCVQDPDRDSLDTLAERISRICTLLGVNAGEVLPRISIESDLSRALHDTRLVIEAAPEILALKRELFAQCERQTAHDTVLASNTSVIPITAISEGLQHPERVLGAHFWNPPHLVPLVEVVLMCPANRVAADWLTNTLRALQMRPVLVHKDIPGFVGNRLQHALKREAIALVAAGVCDAETIDEVVRVGFGARLAVLGPLEQSDLVGLDLTKKIHDILIPDLDVTSTTHPYLTDLVARGALGMKTGQGFRRWTPESAQAVRDRLSEYLACNAASLRDSGTGE